MKGLNHGRIVSAPRLFAMPPVAMKPGRGLEGERGRRSAGTAARHAIFVVLRAGQEFRMRFFRWPNDKDLNEMF